MNVEDFEKELNEEKKAGQEMLDLNQRIYHQMVPNEEEVVFEKKKYDVYEFTRRLIY